VYTMYDFDGLLGISDTKVNIPLIPAYREVYDQLQLPEKYITVNYGCGYSRHNNEKGFMPNKVWPLEYYEQYIRLFHNKYKTIKVVQVGRKDSPHMKNADFYVMGESLEVVKYVLQNSLLHIDCEGGLTHIATQLGTKCIVLFGPTPLHFFAYKQNINIKALGCSECCFLLEDDLACLKGLKRPECMESIFPEQVMKQTEFFFTNNTAQKHNH